MSDDQHKTRPTPEEEAAYAAHLAEFGASETVFGEPSELYLPADGIWFAIEFKGYTEDGKINATMKLAGWDKTEGGTLESLIEQVATMMLSEQN